VLRHSPEFCVLTSVLWPESFRGGCSFGASDLALPTSNSAILVSNIRTINQVIFFVNTIKLPLGKAADTELSLGQAKKRPCNNIHFVSRKRKICSS